MKKYFDFTLSRKQFLPIWLIFFLIVLVPYGLYYNSLKKMSQTGTLNPMIGWVFIGYVSSIFYIVKITIENIKYKQNTKLRFGYDIEPLDDFKFIWGQLLLAIITIGIYYPWAYSKIG